MVWQHSSENMSAKISSHPLSCWHIYSNVHQSALSLLPSSHPKHFQLVSAPSNSLPSFSIVTGSNCCRLPIKITEEVSIPAAAKEIRVDAAIAAVLSELDAIFWLKEDQRAARKACLDGKDVFSLFLGKRQDEQRSTVTTNHTNRFWVALNMAKGSSSHLLILLKRRIYRCWMKCVKDPKRSAY